MPIILANSPEAAALPFGGFRNEADRAAWTDPNVTRLYGIAPIIGAGGADQWNAFRAYTDKVQAGGQAEAARQAAADDDGGFGQVLTLAALAAAAYFAGPAVFAAEGSATAAAGWTAADAAATYGTFEAVGSAAAAEAAGVSAGTWASFGQAASTADLYGAAVASAVNTSVADYAAAAALGESAGAATAFSMLPVSSLGPAASAGFLESALSIAKEAKSAMDVIRVVNTATKQQSVVPRNAPIPAGWAVDARWSPSLGDGLKYSYDPATGGLMLQKTTTTGAESGVMPASGNVPPWVGLAVAVAALLYFW